MTDGSAAWSGIERRNLARVNEPCRKISHCDHHAPLSRSGFRRSVRLSCAVPTFAERCGLLFPADNK